MLLLYLDQSSGLLKRNDSTTTSVDGSTTENEKNAKIQKDKADEAIKLKLALETEAKTKAVADAKAEASNKPSPPIPLQKHFLYTEFMHLHFSLL